MTEDLEKISKREANELFSKDIKINVRAGILCGGISVGNLICAVSPCGRDPFMTGAIFVLLGIAAYYNSKKVDKRVDDYNSKPEEYIEEYHKKIIE